MIHKPEVKLKPQNSKWLLAKTILMAMVVLSCTKSPFSDTNAVEEQNVIRGRVTLADQSPPEDVFVWFEPFDISTRTDEQGRFDLKLPPAATQPGGGLSGAYKVYFLLHNYGLDSVTVTLYNGNLQLDQSVVTSSGELAEEILLSPLLTVQAITDKEFIDNSIDDTLRVLFVLQATDDAVTVRGTFSSPSFKGDPEYSTGFVSKAESDTCLSYYRLNKGHRTVTFQIDNTPTTLSPFEIIGAIGEFDRGVYQFFPNISIEQQHIPPGMTRNLRAGEVGDECSEYMRLPIRVGNNFFRVIHAGEHVE